MSDVWSELEEETAGQPGVSAEGDGFHADADLAEPEAEEVVDVDANEQPEKKSRAGTFAIAGVALVVGLGVVGVIGSKMMSILSPSGAKQARVENVRPLQQPLEPTQPVVAMPGGMPSKQVSETVIASPSPPSPAAAQPPASTVVQPPAVATADPVLAQDCKPDKAELDALRKELDAANAKLAAIDAEKQRLADARAKRSQPQRYAQKKPATSQRKVAVAPKKEKPAAVVAETPAPAVPAESKPVTTAGNVETKSLGTGGNVAEAGDKKSSLPGYSLIAMYPNTGDFKAVHLRDARGRNVVVREGEQLGTARVTRIDPKDWLVETTEGVIR